MYLRPGRLSKLLPHFRCKKFVGAFLHNNTRMFVRHKINDHNKEVALSQDCDFCSIY